ncbi:MAG TPA: glycosyltransferase family 4 protein [Flavobacteriales bacterium]|nr:hypothetical protein [Flavobacterium sp.]HRE73168.1 glycosyltransferase family 4 protein [Flavobacteriales bacterium]
MTISVLLVIPNLQIGGAEVTVVNLANSLSRVPGVKVYLLEAYISRNPNLVQTISPEVIIASYEPGFLIRIIDSCVNFTGNWFQGKNFRKDRFFHFFQLKYIRNLLNRTKFDIVNSHLPAADFFVYQMWDFRKSEPDWKWIVSMHGSYEYYQFPHPLSKVIFKHVDGVLYLSDKNLRVLSEAEALNPGMKTMKLYNCLGDWQLRKKNERMIELPKRSENTFRYILVSRPSIEKGWEEVIHAFIMMFENNQNVELILCGESDYKVEMQKKYCSYKNIHFIGFCSDPISLMKQCDVGVLASYFESLPYSIMEYLFAGLPVIATRVGEVPDMLVNPQGLKAGQLIEISESGKPDVKKLAQCMIEYYNNRALFENHKNATSTLFERFNAEKWAADYIDFCSSLISESHG